MTVTPIRPGIDLPEGLVEIAVERLIRCADATGCAVMAIAVHDGEATIYTSQHAYTEWLSVLGALEVAADHIKNSSDDGDISEEETNI